MRSLKAHLLACLTLQPERADGENIGTAVAPWPTATTGTPPAKGTSQPAVGGGGTAALLRKLGHGSAGDASKPEVTILYGSETGTAQSIAEFIQSEAKARGFEAKPPLPLDTWFAGHSSKAGCPAAIIICSTAANGEPPKNAAAFSATLLSEPGPDVKGMSFALLGLGDSAYGDAYLRAPRALRRRLQELGAAELVAPGECDGEDGIAKVLEGWVESLWPQLKVALQKSAPSDDGIKAVPAAGTLFNSLGGSDAVAAILEVFLGKALADWRVKRFFDMAQKEETVRGYMGQWLAAAFGGPLPYRGPDVSALHFTLAQGKGLTAAHLDAIVHHLEASMEELGMPQDNIREAAGVVTKLRQQICGA